MGTDTREPEELDLPGKLEWLRHRTSLFNVMEASGSWELSVALEVIDQLMERMEPFGREAAFYLEQARDTAKARYPGDLLIGQLRACAEALGMPRTREELLQRQEGDHGTETTD